MALIQNLTPEEIQATRQAANAIIDAIDLPSIGIDDQFDPVRRNHLVAAQQELQEALEMLDPDSGTYTGAMPASQLQALRDAIGAEEAMLTKPVSERLLQLGVSPDRSDLAVLGNALSKIPAPNEEDLAYSDVRYGGSDPVLRRRVDYGELLQLARPTDGEDTDPQIAYAELDRMFRGPVEVCDDADRIIVTLFANAAAVADGPEMLQGNLRDRFAPALDSILDAATLDNDEDCYTDLDRRRIVVSRLQLEEAVERGSVLDAQIYAQGAAEMVAWARSTRQRKNAIGL
jgi:hypothetical protein